MLGLRELTKLLERFDCADGYANMNRILITSILVMLMANVFAVEFTLHNKTSSSIPLWIPSVMNPNLSPNSDSGVDLKVGQKVYFKYRGKKRVLLSVTEEFEGKTLDVAQLLEERKKEIDALR